MNTRIAVLSALCLGSLLGCYERYPARPVHYRQAYYGPNYYAPGYYGGAYYGGAYYGGGYYAPGYYNRGYYNGGYYNGARGYAPPTVVVPGGVRPGVVVSPPAPGVVVRPFAPPPRPPAPYVPGPHNHLFR